MSSTGKGSIKLATNQTLTADYAATNIIPSCSVSEESLATLDITYVTGSGEASAALNFQVEFSYDGSTWVKESYGSLSSGVNTIAPIVNKLAGGAGGTTYTGQYVIPLCSRNFRILVKETGVNSNFGTVSIVWTVAAASGQERNLQAGASSGDATAANQVTGNASLASIDSKTPALGQALAAGSVPVVLTAAQLTTLTPPTAMNVSGDVASGVANSGNPLQMGGRAATTNPAAVADGQRVGVLLDKVGRQVTVNQAPRQLVTDLTTTITSSTAETTILGQVASTFLDATAITITNTSATGTRVDIRDTTSGTVRWSVWVPANDIRGMVFQVPLTQTTVNTNWTAQSSVSVSDLRVFIQAVKNI